MQALEFLSICNRHGVALPVLTYSKYLISEKKLAEQFVLYDPIHAHTRTHTYIYIYL